MAQTHQDTNVNQLVINKMTKQEYDNLSQVSETELYLVEEQVDNVVTQNSTNPVQSGAVYEALQDIGSAINDGTTIFTKNNETIGTTSANQSDNKTIALPNDIVMCNLIENKALASYATPVTRFKYIEDHGWVDMDRSDIQYNEGTGEWTGTFVSLDITEGEYYYDMDNDTVFVADENSEMQDVTSTVIIQGDSNKLYCDTTTNMLYRYDGTDFIALTSEGKTYTLSSNNENIRLTDSDGQTQDVSLNTLINGLSVGNSDPQDDDYIISQYVNGGTTTTTYHRRPLSKFWNWIKTKLGIGTNDGTFLRKDGTWVIPTDSTKVAKAGDTMSGNLTTPALKISGGRVQGSGDDEGIVIVFAPNNYATLCLGGASGERSVFTIQSSTHNVYWRYNDGNVSYDINHPKKTGTIALTSDIPSISGKVDKSGDTMSGNLTISKSTATDTDFISENARAKVALEAAQSGNHGVWSWGYFDGTSYVSSAKWLIHRDLNGNIKVNGHTIDSDIPANAVFTDTWRGVQDNLTSSTNTTESLSAKQGYLLANGSARDNTKVLKAGDTMTGKLQVNNIIFANNFTNARNSATIVIDKAGSNYTGIGANNVTDTVYFSACNASGEWVDSYKQIWDFNGTIKQQGNPVVTSVKVGNTSYNPSSGVVSLPDYPSEPTSGGITISKYSTASTLTIDAYSCSYYGRIVSGYIQFTTSSTISAGNNLFLLSTKTSAQNICFIVSTDNGGDIRILKVVGNSGTIQNVPALPSGKTFYGHFSFITT